MIKAWDGYSLEELAALPVSFITAYAALVEMARLMNREHEVETVLARLHRFIEMDMGGQIVQITGTRVMLLPPGCVGISGLEDEAFNDEAGWSGGV